MHSIKIHLAQAEYDAVARFAQILRTVPEAVAYAALNRLMLDAANPEIRKDVVETWAWHGDNLPLWSDSAGSVHAYEAMPDEEPTPSKYSQP